MPALPRVNSDTGSLTRQRSDAGSTVVGPAVVFMLNHVVSYASYNVDPHEYQPDRHADPADMLRRLRQHHRGVLTFDEHVEEVAFVLDPLYGEPVLPIKPLALMAESVMLFAPDDSLANPDCLQVHASPEEIDPNREEACDRHAAYFGRPAHTRWARLHVESIKRLDCVLDGDLVRLANPLRRHESSLCRAVNSRPIALARACERLLGVRPEQPFMLGVDPWGADVRARFGVLRLDFDSPASTPAEAASKLSLLLQERIEEPREGRAS